MRSCDVCRDQATFTARIEVETTTPYLNFHEAKNAEREIDLCSKHLKEFDRTWESFTKSDEAEAKFRG